MIGDFDEKYTPLFNITNQMLTVVSSISEKIGHINITSNLEANSLSLGQVRDVINERF